MTMPPPKMMPAYRITDWGEAPALVEVSVPEPGPGEVRVRVAGCGLCHSDLTMVTMTGEIGQALGWRVPFTLGHEVAGWVDGVGPGVADVFEHLVNGTPVAVVAAGSCGTCAACVAGHQSRCPSGITGRGYGRDGGLAGWVVAPAADLVVLGGALDPALSGPFTDAGATSMHAVERVLPALADGSSVAVIGVGGLGSLALQILAALTPARITAVDLDPVRREASLAAGAHRAVDQLDAKFDAIIDIVGDDATISASMKRLAEGGAYVLVGAERGGLRGAWWDRLPREAMITRIQGSSRRHVERVVALAAEGRVRIETRSFTLDHVADAYAALESGSLVGRAVVHP